MAICGCFFFFFFQAEDGIRDVAVTGVQTCALPISRASGGPICGRSGWKNSAQDATHGRTDGLREQAMDRLRAVEREGLRTDLPAFDPGDTVRVMVRVREGDKERLQAFEGVCIARRGAGINATFTVRKISAGVGVERIFPLHAPSIAAIELMRKGR